MAGTDKTQQVNEQTASYGVQGENGVDISLLVENLKPTPTERLVKAQNSLESVKRKKDEHQPRRGVTFRTVARHCRAIRSHR